MTFDDACMALLEREGQLTQGEVATLLGVDRSTIHEWQRKGLPYSKAGRENVYDFGMSLHWMMGNRIAQGSGSKLKPLQTLAVGYMASYVDGPFGGAELECFKRLADRAGYDERQSEGAVEFACGYIQARAPRLLPDLEAGWSGSSSN